MKHLEKRSQIIQAIREFFYLNGYIEVETPIRIPSIIPEEHIEPFSSDGWYLQSSPEICMKRLAAQGYGKIFQICRCFRRDERGSRHLTELTMLEWYRKDYSYIELMNECEEMVKYVGNKLNKSAEYIEYGDHKVNFNNSWNKITVSDSFKIYGSISMEAADKNGSFDEVMAFEIEPNLGIKTPAFIYDYPASKASLAKLKSDNKNLAERFELYIAGIEIANGFSELNDPVEQKDRLIKEINYIKKRDIERNGSSLSKPAITEKITKMPEKFIQDLSKMPKTAGIALGVDRLVMVFTNSPIIDDVVAFTPEEL